VPESCAYLVARYPGASLSFILGEVQALRDAGVRVETASVRRAEDWEVLSDRDRAERDTTRALLPVSTWKLLTTHARALTRHPRAYLATLLRALQLAHAGGRVRLWQLFYFAEAILFWEWMEQERLHHVHVHFANVSSDVAMIACGFANAAGAQPRWTWSMTLHGPVELADVASHKLAAKANDAVAVVCISDFAHSQVAALVEPETVDRLHTIRCGIDVTAFAPRKRQPGDGGQQEILCVGALQRRKAHRVLLEAFAEVLAALPGVRLTLVGGGPERDALERRTAELGIGEAVEFAGSVGHDRVGDFYARADVFCLPSFAEGVPTVLMEAMAMEVPVVATRIMGIPELVEHERSGLLVAPARPDELADALRRLLTDRELAERLGREGRKQVSARYNRPAATAALHELLSPLISH
jgi:glycosyltransferase involved in cell wall biosynthesis